MAVIYSPHTKSKHAMNTYYRALHHAQLQTCSTCCLSRPLFRVLNHVSQCLQQGSQNPGFLKSPTHWFVGSHSFLGFIGFSDFFIRMSSWEARWLI